MSDENNQPDEAEEFEIPDISDDVAIDNGILLEEFVTHAEKYSKWSFLSEQIKGRVTYLKNDLEWTRAVLNQKSREHAVISNEARKKAGQKEIRYTETMYDNDVICQVSYQDIIKRLAKAQKAYGLATAGRGSMEHRKDMLIQLGYANRPGADAGPIVMDSKKIEEARRLARERALAARQSNNGGSRSVPPKAAEEPPKVTSARRPPGKRPPGKHPPKTNL